MQGKYQSAMTTLEKALHEQAEGYAGKHANAAAHLQLGRVFHATGRLEEAREQYQQASEIQSAELPEGHPDLVTAQLAMAQLEADFGEFSKALEKIESATIHFAPSVTDS